MTETTSATEPVVLDSLVSFDQDRTNNDLIIKREQHIPQDFLDDLARTKVDSLHKPAGDFYHVASIPVEVVDDLMRRYNFDVMNAPVRETLKMLNRLALDNFILTNKRI